MWATLLSGLSNAKSGDDRMFKSHDSYFSKSRFTAFPLLVVEANHKTSPNAKMIQHGKGTIFLVTGGRKQAIVNYSQPAYLAIILVPLKMTGKLETFDYT